MLSILLIGLGGATGSILRYGLSNSINLIFGKNFYLGIFFCNIIGCFLIGLGAAYLSRSSTISLLMEQNLRNLLIVGFLGGFTTFSSFSLDVLTMINKGEIYKAIFYILASLLLSLFFVFLGYILVINNK